MAIVCASCDQAPPAAAAPGAMCPACGGLLISVATEDELAGTVIDGRFEVLGRLGRGGMGVVYRARQLSIGRDVALKVLDRRIEKDVASVKRFFREAKLASTLAHPHTVPIIDFGQSPDGRLFLVMELVAGRTLLEEMTAVGPLPLARVIGIGTQLCDALEAAHDKAIVHRDLKLENVMLLAGKRDHVKILDFGLARSLTDPTTQMTATGLISGTPRYMPPEVAMHAAPPEPSQDIYALGVMLAELAVGRALWVAPTLEALITKKLDAEKSLGEVPEPLRGVARALLADDPAQRPTAAAARELLSALEPATSAPSVPRARSPVALEPTADIAVTDPFANLALVDLDDRDGPRSKPSQAAPAPTMHAGPLGTLALDDAFGAPPEPVTLQLNADDLASREAKRRAQHEVVIVKRRKPIAGWLAAGVVLVAAACASAYYLVVYKPAHRERALSARGVEIEITAARPVAITLDGKPAGTTPVSLKLAKGTRTILIEGEGVLPQQIVADRDQTIRLLPASRE